MRSAAVRVALVALVVALVASVFALGLAVRAAPVLADASCGSFTSPTGTLEADPTGQGGPGKTGAYTVSAGGLSSMSATFNWGDGTVQGTSLSSGASHTFSHVYTQAGSYPTLLTVSGVLGDGTTPCSNSVSGTATVTAPPQPPPVNPRCTFLPVQVPCSTVPEKPPVLKGPLSSPGVSKAINLVDKTLNNVGNGIAVVIAYSAFAPEPVISKAAVVPLALTAATAKLGGSLIGLAGAIVDPPDPNYRVIARTARIAGPHVRVGHGAASTLAAAVNGLSDNAAQLRSVIAALVVATDRASGAAQAKDHAARVRQLKAAAQFARNAAKLIAAGPQLDLRLVHGLRAARVPLVFSPATVSGGVAQVAQSGLPHDVAAALRRFGISNAGIQEFTQEVAHQSVTGRVNLAVLLTSRTLAKQQQTTANGFLALSNALAKAA